MIPILNKNKIADTKIGKDANSSHSEVSTEIIDPLSLVHIAVLPIFKKKKFANLLLYYKLDQYCIGIGSKQMTVQLNLITLLLLNYIKYYKNLMPKSP